MFDNITAMVFVEPKNNTVELGVRLGLWTQNTEVVEVGLGINGIALQFEAISGEELLIPLSSDYKAAHEIDTIFFQTQLKFGVTVGEGNIPLTSLYDSLLGNEYPLLVNTLPGLIETGDIGDTLVFDLKATINIGKILQYMDQGSLTPEEYEEKYGAFNPITISDVIKGIQLRLKISSEAAPDKFTIEIIYYKDTLYKMPPCSTSARSSSRKSRICSHTLRTSSAAARRRKKSPKSPKTPKAARANDVLEDSRQLVRIAIDIIKGQGIALALGKDAFSLVGALLNLDLDKYIENVVSPSAAISFTPGEDPGIPGEIARFNINFDFAVNSERKYSKENGYPVRTINGKPVTIEADGKILYQLADEHGNGLYQPVYGEGEFVAAQGKIIGISYDIYGNKVYGNPVYKDRQGNEVTKALYAYAEADGSLMVKPVWVLAAEVNGKVYQIVGVDEEDNYILGYEVYKNESGNYNSTVINGTVYYQKSGRRGQPAVCHGIR